MSRYMPTECRHGNVTDYGDFGPCQNCDEHDDLLDDGDCPNFANCPQCDEQRPPDPIWIPCEGSACQPCWDDYITGMCAMCGRWRPLEDDGTMPAHNRTDIIAMLARGDFDGATS